MKRKDEDFPLRSAMDNTILMHREAHFGGNFKIMINYYEKGGKGICQDFELSRIYELAEYETETDQNLAGLLLTEPEAEILAESRKTYKRLKDLYSIKEEKVKYPRLIADLILSEEENPENEIEAIVKEGTAIVPSLIELIKAEAFYDPLFPGYGTAPINAAACLGQIGDKRAIIALYEMIGEEDFFDENILLDALYNIGQPAKEFLLRVLHSRPLNFDNERAAIALITFKNDPEVTDIALNMLLQPEIRQQIPLSTYLALICEGLTDPSSRKKFEQLGNDPTTPRMLIQDIKSVIKEWK